MLSLDAGKILKSLESGHFLLTAHAAERMAERSVTRGDIVSCALTARFVSYQSDRAVFRIDGLDSEGEPLTVICALLEDVLIVTVY